MTNSLQSPRCPQQRSVIFWLSVTLAFFLLLYSIRAVLLPFVLGMATAYFLDPAADRLQRLRFSRNCATITITGGFFLLIALLLLFIIPLLAGQLSDLLTLLPSYITQMEREVLPQIERRLRILSPALAAEFKSSIASSSGLIARAGADFVGRILSSGVAFMNILSLILITPIVAFYTLRDWDRILAHLNALLPRAKAPVIREQLQLVNKTLAGFVRGQLNVCLLLGAYYSVFLSFFGLNFGVVIGLATGFLVIFPYVGAFVGMATGMAVAFFQFGDMTRMAMIFGVFLTGQLLEGMFITPKLVGDKVGLHPVWIIFAMLAGGALFGFVGVLLAVPTAAVIGVLLRFVVQEYQKSSYFQ